MTAPLEGLTRIVTFCSSKGDPAPAPFSLKSKRKDSKQKGQQDLP